MTQPDHERPLATDDRADLPARDHQHGHHQRVEDDRGLDPGDRGPEVIRDRRDRHVHDGAVERHQELPGAQREEDDPGGALCGGLPLRHPADDSRFARWSEVTRRGRAEVVQRALPAAAASAPCRSPAPAGSARRATGSAARRAPGLEQPVGLLRDGLRRDQARAAWRHGARACRRGSRRGPSANAITTAAVFGPTPGSDVRYARASRRPTRRAGARGRSRPSRSRDLAQDRLDPRRPSCSRGRRERIASATAGVGASTTSSHVGYAARSDANARSAFRSLVCCESTVRTSSSSGSTRRGGSSAPEPLLEPGEDRAHAARRWPSPATRITAARRGRRCGTA